MLPDDRTLHQTVFRALRAALALSASEADRHLLRAYAETPAAEPSPQTDVCYYFLQTDAQSRLLQETEVQNSQHHAYSYIPCRLILVFYGPSCESWAHRCRTFLYLDGRTSPRGILREAGLFPVPFPQPPSILYEETGKAFRKRADLTLDLRLLDDSAYGSAISHAPIPVDTIQTPPSVTIHVSE